MLHHDYLFYILFQNDSCRESTTNKQMKTIKITIIIGNEESAQKGTELTQKKRVENPEESIYIDDDEVEEKEEEEEEETEETTITEDMWSDCAEIIGVKVPAAKQMAAEKGIRTVEDALRNSEISEVIKQTLRNHLL